MYHSLQGCDVMSFNDMVKKQRNINKGIVESTLSPYELVRIQDDRVTDESEMSGLINISDRYHIVDYNGKTLATAKTLEDCIPQINKVSGWGADAVIDQKDLVAYDIKYNVWGAGHSYASHLIPRY